MIRPAYLQPGDKIALIAPAGTVSAPDIEQVSRLLADWQLVPYPAPHLLADSTPLGGTERERLDDWQQALDEEDTRAILCLSNRYGSLHLVEEADYSTFQGNPKWIIGCDDITIFHAKLHTLGIESLYARLPLSPRPHDQTALTQVRNFLFGILSDYAIPPHPDNRPGYAEGELIGGNLGWIHALRSTRVEHNTRHTLLYIEDPTDDLLLIDRHIRCLRYSDIFHQIEGLIVGQFGTRPDTAFRQEAYRIIRAAVDDFNFPICFNFPAGPVSENYPLLLGSRTLLSVTSTGSQLHFP